MQQAQAKEHQQQERTVRVASRTSPCLPVRARALRGAFDVIPPAHQAHQAALFKEKFNKEKQKREHLSMVRQLPLLGLGLSAE